ncbi:uncharacterized protein Z518_08323 [Rhinocladiella mackenziei CBS 650.93]|uniref:Uncharacterized protein n=1 Tax=Rhinocladiella mackenziei CBS 650.93 TaxID=1442369 RepID=A0A0D2FK81_9EURO|nr:uncharacterized protein Z518_08323 [Rhinocladiella mackenziei CBS 650.93]KIX02382.1 hypothetical protein Z518_08323 [Rhinocladiella mackenziei CBS 650.93]
MSASLSRANIGELLETSTPISAANQSNVNIKRSIEISTPNTSASKNTGSGSGTSAETGGYQSGMKTLEKSFPGILDYLHTSKGSPQALTRQGQTLQARKRARTSVESDLSLNSTSTPPPNGNANGNGKIVKKPKLDKDPASAAKSSATVESSAAEKGDLVRGFRAFCVKPDCNETVTGKTSVLDAEVIEFLLWYDRQSAAVTSGTAQLHVLSTALAKSPEDDDIKRKLDAMQNQLKRLRLKGEVHGPCNLLQAAKLVRKPY